MDDIIMRKCKKCNIEKKLYICFYKYSKDAYRWSCKVCCNEKHTIWIKNNKHSVNDHVKKWVNNNRDRWNEYEKKYKKDNYDPVKRHDIYMKYMYGNDNKSNDTFH